MRGVMKNLNKIILISILASCLGAFVYFDLARYLSLEYIKAQQAGFVKRSSIGAQIAEAWGKRRCRIRLFRRNARCAGHVGISVRLRRC